MYTPRRLTVMIRRCLAYLAGGAALTLVVAACGSGSTSGSGSATGANTSTGAAASSSRPVLRVGMVNYGASLDPTTPTAPNAQIQVLSNEPIIYGEPNGQYVPGLATSWRYIGGGTKNFEFTLRHNARFSDGSPVTAAALKAWFLFFASSHSEYQPDIPIKSIDTVGNWTVILHLKAPTPDLPSQLSEFGGAWGFVVSPKAFAHPAGLATQPDGAGEYEVVPSQTVTGSVYTFVPNPYYYNPSAAKFSKVIIKIITQPSTMLAAITSGQLDVANGDPTTVDAAKSAGLQIVQAPTGWDGLFFFDKAEPAIGGPGRNPLSSLDVRRALNYAIDRSVVTKAILGAYGAPTSEGPSTDGYDPSYANYYPYDPAKAKALLAAAGYPHGFTLTILSQSWWGTIGDRFLEATAQYLSAVGVTLNIKTGYTNAKWNSDAAGGQYYWSGFVQTPLIPTYEWYEYFLGPKALLNQHGYDDPVMDSLYQRGVNATTPVAAAGIWRQMMARVVTQADEVPVFEEPSFWYVAKGFGGVAFNGATGYPYPTDWYPTK